MSKLIFGFGVNDSTETATEYAIVNGQRVRVVKPIQAVWRSLLERCNSIKYKERRPHYMESSMYFNWKYFSIFNQWAESRFHANHQLDKDLLVPGNNIYSPDNCLFIPPKINIMLTTNLGKRNPDLYLGVIKQITPYQLKKPFSAKVGTGEGQSKHLGYFHTPEEAHQAWQMAKADYIEDCILWWKTENYFSRSFNSQAEEALVKRVDSLRFYAKEGLITLDL